jgi:hypothetical protein
MANACSIIIIISLFLISLIKALDKAEAPHTHRGVEPERVGSSVRSHSRVMTFSYNELAGCRSAWMDADSEALLPDYTHA